MGLYSVTSAAFALVAATEKTVIRWNTPASRAGRLRRIIVTDRLAGATDSGIAMQLYTAGTDGTGTSYTPLPLNNVAACVGTAKTAYTVEPTASVAHMKLAVPAGGGLDVSFGDAELPWVAHSSAIAIALTSPEARGSGIVTITAIFEE